MPILWLFFIPRGRLFFVCDLAEAVLASFFNKLYEIKQKEKGFKKKKNGFKWFPRVP